MAKTMPKTKKKRSQTAATKLSAETERAALGPATAKATRWNLRVAQVVDETVRKAARISNRNLTEFVEQAAASEAERVLADRTRFVLDPEQWQCFVALLDRPPQDNPSLVKLFAKPNVFA